MYYTQVTCINIYGDDVCGFSLPESPSHYRCKSLDELAALAGVFAPDTVWKWTLEEVDPLEPPF